ncbi:MAG: acyclic terpene utilization AtuA family protein [Planctomycetota bacterium]
MTPPVRIANVQAFWGDYSRAAVEMLQQDQSIDYLTLDYLAEVSMSILAKQQSRKPDLGYPQDFLQVVRSIAPFWAAGSETKVVANAGGLAPMQCAKECAKIVHAAGCGGRKIGVVSGDSVLTILASANGNEELYRNLDTGQQLCDRTDDLVTANAYVGAEAIVQALEAGCDLVITGRVADPSMVVAPCVHHHGWSLDDYDRLAGATVAGHLIECGTHVTGGISTDWLAVENVSSIGYPIVEIDADGACVVTKPNGTGGVVNSKTVTEQLLYELGDPENYLSPDCSVSFLGLQVEDLGSNRVSVKGAIGREPPTTLKVSATQHVGYHAAGTLVVFGENAVEKAKRAGNLVLERLRSIDLEPAESRIECLGSGATVPLQHLQRNDAREVVLRVAVADPQRAPVTQFANDWTSLVCCGPQGTTGYAGGRPRVSETYGYWPCLIDSDAVEMKVEVLEV